MEGTTPSPFPQTGFTVEEDRLKLSKIGHIKIKLHREVQGKIKRLTIQRKGSGKWFAVFSIELSNLNITNNYPAVGIDLGLKEFAVLSNGDKVKRERFFKEEGKNLAKAQRKMSKLERDSKEGKRQTKTLCKIHERITNKRSNFTHQLSFKLANTYGKICIENLDIKGMLEKKNIKVNGKEVKATKTHKSISDVAWNQFVQQLVYKVEYTGGQVIKVNPKDTTKKCSACGKITSKELSDRTHECNWCKLIMDRDLNASKNILRIGMDSLRNRDIPIEAPIHLGYGSIH
jgi:putative transposase